MTGLQIDMENFIEEYNNVFKTIDDNFNSPDPNGSPGGGPNKPPLKTITAAGIVSADATTTDTNSTNVPIRKSIPIDSLLNPSNNTTTSSDNVVASSSTTGQPSTEYYSKYHSSSMNTGLSESIIDKLKAHDQSGSTKSVFGNGILSKYERESLKDFMLRYPNYYLNGIGRLSYGIEGASEYPTARQILDTIGK